ncbi:MAG: SigE family RNA polymerase sigma factor [Actinomycetota bacterium]|nr:SigE family RNA polymerase sigma factor [Actinomycetota bacterium]
MFRTGTDERVFVRGERALLKRTPLADLYDRHATEAVRLAYLITGDRSAAEDIVQEAFVRIVGRFKQRKHPDVFEAYLRRTVVNLSRNHFRRLKREREFVSRQRTQEFQDSEPQLIDSRDDLWRALLDLPSRQRTAIVLRYFVDLTEQECADVMGSSPGAVKSAMHRGMEALRRAMGAGTNVKS